MPERGTRVRLVRCADPWTRLEPGELGTVLDTDSLGTVHIAWDSGARLGLVRCAGDAWEVVREEAPA